MNDKDLRVIQDLIDYDFNNVDLLQQAFVRRSYAKENGGEDNEILEFIGDKSLDIVIVRILVEMFGFYTSECDDYDKDEDFNEFCCEHSEGKLTALKQRLVGKKTLACCIDRLQLADYLIMGNGDRRNHVEREDSVKEDLFEAIVGAVTLDSSWDFEKIRNVVECLLLPEELLSEGKEDNYIELIQEWSLRQYQELPRMRTNLLSRYGESVAISLYGTPGIVKSEAYQNRNQNCAINLWGNSNINKPQFKCELDFKGMRERFIGYGESKSEARRDVCKCAYNYLEKNGQLFSIQDEIYNPNKADAINQLEILARRGYFSLPIYNFELRHDKNGNPIWKCECHIKEHDTHFCSESSSKKDAKKSAAFKMLKYVLDDDSADTAARKNLKF